MIKYTSIKIKSLIQITSSEDHLASRAGRLGGHLLQHRFEDVLSKLGQFVIFQIDLCICIVTCK
jgi:DNA-directed RNA polymerase beta subunit